MASVNPGLCVCGKPKTRISIRCAECAKREPTWHPAQDGYMRKMVKGRWILQRESTIRTASAMITGLRTLSFGPPLSPMASELRRSWLGPGGL